jgi:hypothetical protein
MINIKKLAFSWVKDNQENAKQLKSEFYCQTSDIFQTRLNKMRDFLLQQKTTPENDTFLIEAMAGEIGNNSFDHNIGSWPDMPGIFFSYDFSQDKKVIILADRGQGVFNTLKKVRPELTNDAQALKTAFLEKISGRAPENRGNGLKFVKQNIKQLKMHLIFISGNAQIELNDKMKIIELPEKINGCLAILEF